MGRGPQLAAAWEAWRSQEVRKLTVDHKIPERRRELFPLWNFPCLTPMAKTQGQRPWLPSRATSRLRLAEALVGASRIPGSTENP
mmetsp:Transcript_44367/g.129039  ORF Transcript_44367/g.129039 Transcript_44367/m.129039 type:complete len:85 (+) Transcript_44367:134-388(+)